MGDVTDIAQNGHANGKMNGHSGEDDKKVSSGARSQQIDAQSMTLWEKLDCVPAVASILGAVMYHLVSGLFTSDRPKAYFKHVAYSAIKKQGSRMSVKQIHYLLPGTDQVYYTWCEKKGVKPQSVVLEDGTQAHWVGDPSAEKIIICLHGGGYCMPAGTQYFIFLNQVHKQLTAEGKSVACLLLSYDLAPIGAYPRQLHQATALLRHVTTTLDKKPSNIVFIGDSAGGNLTAALLSHLARPHTSIPPLKLSEPLAGAVLVSPWISYSVVQESYKCESKDLITVDAGKKWSASFMGNAWPHEEEGDSDGYSHAITAENGWWKDVGEMVGKIYITAGADEVLCDSIVKWTKVLKGEVEGDKVELEVVRDEPHDSCYVDLALGYEETEMGKVVKGWFGSLL